MKVAPAPTIPQLPPGWSVVHSKSQRGFFYYYQASSGRSQWEHPAVGTAPAPSPTVSAAAPPPVVAAASAGPVAVRASHILLKHRNVRNPYSWRDKERRVERTKEAAIEELKSLQAALARNPGSFAQLASRVSDCNSAKRGGDLGQFERGAMQRPFEDAAFALRVGQMSGIVETDSGVHIILRTE